MTTPSELAFTPREQPFTPSDIPATALTYYHVESRRRARAEMRVVLLHMVGIPIAISMLILGGVLNFFPLVLLTVPVVMAWYWGAPRLWRRLVERSSES